MWNSNVIVDRFMGQRTVVVPTDGKSDRYTGRLMGRRRHRNEETQGTLTFTIECNHNTRAT